MRILIISLFSFTYSFLTAQDLPSGQIEVIKDFEVRLTEAKKIRIVPQPTPLDSATRRYEYKLVAASPSIDYLVPEIKPLAINPEQKPIFYPLMAKAGYGSPNSLLAAVSYDHVQNEDLAWGIDLSHLRANNKKIPLQKFADSQARINGSYLLNNSAKIDAYINGHFEKVYFYGADEIPSNGEALRRNFKRYDANFAINSLYDKTTVFHYNGHLRLLTDKDDLGSRETGMNVGGEVGSAIGKKEFPIAIGLLADVSKLKHTSEYPLNNVLAHSHFEYFLGDLKFHLGALALLKKEENEILPDLEVSYGLFNDFIRIRAGWQGEVFKNNFHYFSNLNPYINTRLDSINNRISRKIYAGVKGGAGSLLYEVTGGYTKFERMAFFLQDEDDEEQFNPVYDSGHFIGIEGSVQYGLLKHVTLRAQGSQKFYSLNNESKPWHMPSLDIDGMITYTGGSDEYHVSVIFHGENGLPYRTPGGTETRLDPLLDLNFHGDYFITDNLGAFAEVNNIFGNNRERWAGYPAFGFNIKAGILFRLPE